MLQQKNLDRSRKRAEFYLSAIAAVGVAILVRAAVWSTVGPNVPFITFFPAVIFTAYRGGLGPGLVATALSAVSALYFFVAPFFTFHSAPPFELASLALFVTIGIFISWLCDQMRTARYQAENQKRFWQMTLASIGDAVIATDRQSRVTFLNGVAATLTGWSAAEAAGRLLDEIFVIRNEFTGEPVENPVIKVLRDGQTVGLANHTVLLSRDGRSIPIDDSGAPIRDDDGQLIGVVLVFRDITERHQVETELRNSRQQLLQTLDSITDGFFTLDAGWRFTYLNAAAAQIMRREPSEVIGTEYWAAFPYAVGSVIEERFREVLAEQSPREFEFQSPRTRNWYELRVYPGSEGSLSVYFRNITEHKEYELAAQDREKRLSRLSESNVIGIFFGDVQGAILEANDEFLRMIGRTRDDLGGDLSMPELTPPEYHAIANAARAEARERGACTPYEKELLRPDGSRVPVLIGYVLLGTTRRESVAFVVDLTERRRAEQALRRTNEDLQLFTYGASHDLKEPLRMIAAYSQMLERKYKGKLDQDADDYLHFIADGVRRMRALVDALLEYSRAGEVRHALEGPTSAESALAESLVSLRTAIEESSADITYGPLPEVAVSPLHMTQLFQNLIGNAIQYRSEQSPRLRICAVPNGEQVTFSVADNGLGIPPEFHERVFGVFQRLHGRERSGTGMGLATCKRIVERYGGSIWVESDGEGKGSVFHFTVPGRNNPA